MLTHLTSPDRTGQRLADAVAVAGVRAAAGGTPRAVVLLLGPTAEDASGQQPSAVRRYLELLRVPLAVWSTSGVAGQVTTWHGVEDVSSRKRLRNAAERLEDLLDRQWVVWVDGHHLPSTITLEGAPGLSIAQ